MPTYRVQIPLNGVVTVLIDADTQDEADDLAADYDLSNDIATLQQDATPGRIGYDCTPDGLDWAGMTITPA